jgi:methionyl aminopeptidase
MVEIKTPGEIQAMRTAGRVVAKCLAATREHAAVGMTLKELDEIAHEVIRQAGATSPFLNYKPAFASVPFPAVICASLNDEALHGIPDSRRLADGDLLSVDCGATLDGWTGDAAISFSVGEPRPEDTRLIETAQAALTAGIAQAVPGNRIGDISAAIGRVGRTGGYGINTDFGGHGVGHTMHEDPSVPNEGRPGRGMKLRAGVVIAIEPWFMAGGNDGYYIADDGWTVCSADRSRAVHVEHTVAVTDSGPLILTAL